MVPRSSGHERMLRRLARFVGERLRGELNGSISPRPTGTVAAAEVMGHAEASTSRAVPGEGETAAAATWEASSRALRGGAQFIRALRHEPWDGGVINPWPPPLPPGRVPPPTPPEPPMPPAPPPPDEEVSQREVLAFGGGAVAAVILLGTVVFCWMKRRARMRKTQTTMSCEDCKNRPVSVRGAA